MFSHTSCGECEEAALRFLLTMKRHIFFSDLCGLLFLESTFRHFLVLFSGPSGIFSLQQFHFCGLAAECV